MELHVFPIPIPPPTSLSTRFLWVFPVHQAGALLSEITPPEAWYSILFFNQVRKMDTGIGREKGRKESNISVGFKEVFKSFIHSFTQQIPTEPLLCFLNIPGIGIPNKTPALTKSSGERKWMHWNIFGSKVKVAQSYPTLGVSMDSSLSGSSVHGILQARILEWIAIPSPGDLPNQGLNPGLPHCRWIPQHLSHQGSPFWKQITS